jgi:hypothetical protein
MIRFVIKYVVIESLTINGGKICAKMFALRCSSQYINEVKVSVKSG